MLGERAAILIYTYRVSPENAVLDIPGTVTSINCRLIIKSDTNGLYESMTYENRLSIGQ